MTDDMAAALVTNDGSKVLMQRAKEMLHEEPFRSLWENMSFHVATVRLREVVPDFPIGTAAQCYMTLVLAAYESLRAAEKMAEAAQ